MVRRKKEGAKSPYMKIHEDAKKKQAVKEQRKKDALNKAFIELGEIDAKHEAGIYKKKQHDTKSKAVLRRLMKVK